MTSILEMREAIVAGIKAELPTLATCEAYHCDLDEEEIVRAFHSTPAVLVAAIDVAAVALEGGQPVAAVVWAAHVMTSSPRPELRDAEALGLVQALLQLVPKTRWGLDSARRAERIRADNLYSGELDSRAVSLWGVSWVQDLELPSAIDLAGLADFARLRTTYDLAPGDLSAEAEGAVELETL